MILSIHLDTNFKYTRAYCAASANTFSMPPLRKLAARYIYPGWNWLDPFARNNDMCEWTNDLDPDTAATYHEDFRVFLQRFEGAPGAITGVVVDPPFSGRQIKEHYHGFGLQLTQKDALGFYIPCWNRILKILPTYVIQVGWHSNGRPKHYDLIEMVQLVHGGNANDTIATVWRRSSELLEEFF